MSLGQHTLDILICRSDAIKLVKALVLWRQKSSRVTFCLTHLIAAPSFSWDFLSAVRDQGTLMNLIVLFEIVGEFFKMKIRKFYLHKEMWWSVPFYARKSALCIVDVEVVWEVVRFVEAKRDANTLLVYYLCAEWKSQQQTLALL